MTGSNVEDICSRLKTVSRSKPVGRVSGMQGGCLRITGLSGHAAIGDEIVIESTGIHAEVVDFTDHTVTALPDGFATGLRIGDAVQLIGERMIRPDDSWIGRVIDMNGHPLDDRRLKEGNQARPLISAALPAFQRKPLGARLETGLSAFNTVLPLVRGQRLGLFAGSGVGKSMLMGRFATGVEADIAVVALIGERGRELNHFINEVLGEEGMKNTIIVAATSDQSAVARRRVAWTAMTVAEHFRDRGRHVMFLADSITRFAEAHREVALSVGENASLNGYPPSISHMIMSLAERAGPGSKGTDGDITAIMSVLVAGSDMEGPIADILRGVLDGHIVLDRGIAERGRYPAIDLLRSVSRSLPEAAKEDENKLISIARHRLGSYDKAELMIQSGLYVNGSDPEVDAAMQVWPHVDSFLSEDSDSIESSFKRLSECLRTRPR